MRQLKQKGKAFAFWQMDHPNLSTLTDEDANIALVDYATLRIKVDCFLPDKARLVLRMNKDARWTLIRKVDANGEGFSGKGQEKNYPKDEATVKAQVANIKAGNNCGMTLPDIPSVVWRARAAVF